MLLCEEIRFKYSEEELAILEKLIDYAERMIYEDKHFNVSNGFAYPTDYAPQPMGHLYEQLRRNAYVKTVVIETERQGRLVYRLGSTEANYRNTASGYCTPHSPVGRIATIAEPGFEHYSQRWGDYSVVEIRSFDRFSGPDFEPNVRNFLRMDIEVEKEKESVLNLRKFVKHKKSKKITEDRKPISAKGETVVEHPPVDTSNNIKITELIVVDDFDEDELELYELDDWGFEEPDSQEEYYGLNERFFTHQTIEQSQIIARSPIGAMFVEGVAGSGKTSAALGRTKMLTTFNMANVVDEQEFRDIVGEDQDYWSSEFAGQFSQESCVGFVRTGELIQYLQETCRRIDLPNLPVLEYKELQARLRQHRGLTRSRVPDRRWMGLAESREAHIATTMSWLYAADQAVAVYIASQLPSMVPSAKALAERFNSVNQAQVEAIAEEAFTQLHDGLQRVIADLELPPRKNRFLLSNLAKRILERVDGVVNNVLDGKIIWVQVADQAIFAKNERELADKLIERKIALYFASGQRLVFVDSNDLIDSSLELLSLEGKPLKWSEETRTLMAERKVIVREPSGNDFYAVASDINHLFMRLLPEATERIYITVKGELRRLQRMVGLGRARLSLHSRNTGSNENEGVDPRFSNIATEFRRVVERALIAPLISVADLYLETLNTSKDLFPDRRVAELIREQLSTFKLADEDIDLLLCLSHLIGGGFGKRGLKQLTEPTFYQAVFIDEVQDFTEQQVFLMVEQANPKYKAVTVVGDLAQKLHHGSSIDLRACFVGQPLDHMALTTNLRQNDAPDLALFSAIYRASLQNGSQPQDILIQSVQQKRDLLTGPHVFLGETELIADKKIIEILIATERHQTVAVLFPNTEFATRSYQRLERELRENLIDSELSEKFNLSRKYIRHFSDVANSKGLEFDVVILVGVEYYDLSNELHVNRLYVGITRARQKLNLITVGGGLPSKFKTVYKEYQELVVVD